MNSARAVVPGSIKILSAAKSIVPSFDRCSCPSSLIIFGKSPDCKSRPLLLDSDFVSTILMIAIAWSSAVNLAPIWSKKFKEMENGCPGANINSFFSES